MKAWATRPREIRNLFNPAFCGEVVFRGIDSYNTSAKKGMPFSLAILLLPLVLHKSTREAVQRGAASYFIRTISNSPEVLIGLPARVRGLMPYSLEAIGMLMQYDAIKVSEDGEIVCLPNCLRKTIKGTDESRACQRASVTLGKKFAEVNDRVTIYMTLGIRP